MRALITGITGQDGSYLAEILLEKGYEVFGLVRRSSTNNLSRIEHLMHKVKLLQGDVSDVGSVSSAVMISNPNEIYNLAAQSFVPSSWKQPYHTFLSNTLGLLNIIQCVNTDTKIFQASTSEMYGNSYPNFNPMSPYGVSKLAAHNIARIYREAGFFISCGIMFNHESPRRGNEFVTKKITNFAKSPFGMLKLGNTKISRDWGYAKDYMKAAWLILQQSKPDDYEIATGESYTLEELLKIALGDKWEEYVEVDMDFVRLNDVINLKGNPEKIKSIGWNPEVNFEQLINMMVNDD